MLTEREGGRKAKRGLNQIWAFQQELIIINKLGVKRVECNVSCFIIILPAATILSNLCDEEGAYHYPCGVLLLHPVSKLKAIPDVDVVFIHGVNGASFYTWRQHHLSPGNNIPAVL